MRKEYLKIRDDVPKQTYKVYKHTFPNGKVYIGITFRDVKKRWGNGNNYKNNRYIDNAIKKYGWDNIKHEVLFDGLSKEDAEKKEIELIQHYKSNNQEYGYNITNGGKHIGMFSLQTKEKMRQAQLGKKMSNETKNKIRVAEQGKKLSLETIEKIKATKKKNGVSQLVKEKSSINGKKCWKLNVVNAWEKRRKAVKQISKDGLFIKEWKSMTDASKELDINVVDICYCCKGKLKTAGGYIWNYA